MSGDPGMTPDPMTDAEADAVLEEYAQRDLARFGRKQRFARYTALIVLVGGLVSWSAGGEFFFAVYGLWLFLYSSDPRAEIVDYGDGPELVLLPRPAMRVASLAAIGIGLPLHLWLEQDWGRAAGAVAGLALLAIAMEFLKRGRYRQPIRMDDRPIY